MSLTESLEMMQGTGAATFTRGSTATYVDTDGVLQYAVTDQARFESAGYKTEGASTNFALHSEDFGNAVWSLTDGAITPSYGTAPDGTSTSTRFIGSGSQPRITDTYSRTIGDINTSSIWIKPTIMPTSCRLFAGNNTGIDVLSSLVLNEWVRISATGDALVSATSRLYLYLSDGADVEIWGAQQEQSPFATSYIPTTSAPVTRAADVLSVPTSGNLPASDEDFTIMQTFEFNTSGAVWLQSFRVAGESTRQIGVKSDGDIFVKNGTASLAIGAHTGLSTVGFVFSGTTATGYVDGVEGGTAAASIATGTPSYIEIGSAVSYGHIKNFKIFDVALTAAEVAAQQACPYTENLVTHLGHPITHDGVKVTHTP